MNQHFLSIWHDQIVRPAFDHAWRDSEFASTYGAEIVDASKILEAEGMKCDKDALAFQGFRTRLRNFSNGGEAGDHVRAAWPPHRWLFGEAWESVMEMLNGHLDLVESQEPVLLAV
jgi:hypothetical protein